MAELINLYGKGPEVNMEVGRFSVSIWRWKKIGLQRRGPDDDSAEKEKQVQRACIRFYGSSYSGQSMDSNCIWCNVDDLRNLAQALDRLNFKEDQ